MKNILHLALFCAGLAVITAYNRPYLPPGPYCGLHNRCCADRKDNCSYKILDSLCYCDEFCDREHDDCCPDYYEVCRGEKPAHEIVSCIHGNKYYEDGQKITINCQECVCSQDPVTKKAGFKCDNDPCIINDEVLRGVNSDPYSTWRAYNYSQFYGKKLKDGLVYSLGTLPLRSETKRMNPIKYGKDIDYPTNFDARVQWPDYISPVVDQEWCGSDWAVTIATVASDRFAIQSNGAEKIVLSPQVLLSCNIAKQKGCAGGHIDVGWNYARLRGLVDEECFPYKASVFKCPFSRKGNLISDRCRPVVKQRTSRYKVGPPYRLGSEQDIMYDIMDSGPVHAVMTVYQDFFHYHDGIYKRSRYGNNQLEGLHSVRIVGWGEDQGEKYWLVANSWGCNWGENGYFRITRGQNESGIESFVVTALSEVTQAYEVI